VAMVMVVMVAMVMVVMVVLVVVAVVVSVVWVWLVVGGGGWWVGRWWVGGGWVGGSVGVGGGCLLLVARGHSSPTHQARPRTKTAHVSNNGGGVVISNAIKWGVAVFV